MHRKAGTSLILYILPMFLGLGGAVWAQSVVIGAGSSEEVGAGARLEVLLERVEVQSGGSFAIAGAAATNPGEYWGSTGMPIKVTSGGTVTLKFAKLQNLGTLEIASGANVTRIHDAVFEDLAGFAPGSLAWIDLSATVAGDRDKVVFSFNRVTFSDALSSARTSNIKAGAGTPLTRILGNAGQHGNRWGETFDDDGSDKVTWHTGSIVRSGGSTFDTVEDALKDSGTTSSSTLTATVGANAFVDDVVDWNLCAGSNSTGPVVRNACLASLVGKIVTDGDTGSGTSGERRGKIVNTVIAWGGVEETTAENCTFFDPRASLLPVANVGGTNCVVESGSAGGDSSFTSSRTDATAAYFIASAGYNFRLLSPGGDAAINTGTALSMLTDFDGEGRGFGGAWDMGADEYVVPTVTTSSHRTRDTTPRIQATGATGTRIAFYRNGSYIGSADVISGVATFDDPTAQADGTYTYAAAYDLLEGGHGPASPGQPTITIDTIPPDAPAQIWATPYNNCVIVEWSPSGAADLLGYKVQRQTWDPLTQTGGPWSTLNPSGVVLGTKYRDDSAVNGATYRYRIIAVDTALAE